MLIFPVVLLKELAGSFTTQALTQALGIELELKKLLAGGSTFKEDSQLLEDTVNARNIALAEELNATADSL